MAKSARRHHLQGDGRLSVTISERGAALVGLRWSGTSEEREIVLDPDIPGYDRDEDPAYIGAVCGRVCGRIAHGQYHRPDGKEIQLGLNNGSHHLHGGGAGALNRLTWRPIEGESTAAQSLTLEAVSPAGAEGYPGELVATITYTLQENILDVQMQAVCDAPCPINLTLHPYFNLSADRQRLIADHSLQIASHGICELDEALLATGRIVDIAGSDNDFRTARKIGGVGLDTVYCLNKTAPAARLLSPEGDLGLTVETDRDTLVVYDGSGLPQPFDAQCGGICLEPQDRPMATRAGGVEHPAGTPWTSWIRYIVEAIPA